jgi:hypothetical protein
MATDVSDTHVGGVQQQSRGAGSRSPSSRRSCREPLPHLRPGAARRLHRRPPLPFPARKATFPPSKGPQAPGRPPCSAPAIVHRQIHLRHTLGQENVVAGALSRPPFTLQPNRPTTANHSLGSEATIAEQPHELRRPSHRFWLPSTVRSLWISRVFRDADL